MRNSKGQFVKGFPHNKGVIRSEDFKEKCRKRQLGKRMSEQTKKRMSLALKKYIHTEEHNKKVSESKIGTKNYMYGKKPSISTRLKMSIAHKGARSYLWRGGINKINDTIRKSVQYKIWREAVFKRDNYKCIWCGKKGSSLNADHIKPFAYHPELRFDVNNGRTLCLGCHKTTETYGHKCINLVVKGGTDEAVNKCLLNKEDFSEKLYAKEGSKF